MTTWCLAIFLKFASRLCCLHPLNIHYESLSRLIAVSEPPAHSSIRDNLLNDIQKPNNCHCAVIVLRSMVIRQWNVSGGFKSKQQHLLRSAVSMRIHPTRNALAWNQVTMFNRRQTPSSFIWRTALTLIEFSWMCWMAFLIDFLNLSISSRCYSMRLCLFKTVYHQKYRQRIDPPHTSWTMCCSTLAQYSSHVICVRRKW